ncbi:MAG: diguanylate cyclase, partial [Proteobacteria bacterium]|nr:diguanylate cyclase [Pseudomonadota bacterium]
MVRSRADKMNLLFQVQLLSRSINDLASAFQLFLDLGRELVPSERAILLWQDAPGDGLRPEASNGFGATVSIAAHMERLVPESAGEWGRPFLLTRQRCASAGLLATLDELGCSCLLSIPVYASDRVHGVMQFLRETSPDFRLEDAHLARVFALAFESVFESLSEAGRDGVIPYVDRATGLFDHRYFDQQLEREIDRARRNGEPVSVLMLEVAGFQEFRSRRGHAASEAVLQEVSRALGRVCRKSDTLARYEEELFAVIMPHTAKGNLGIVAQRVFEGLEGATEASPGGELEFNLCALAYPDDAFSPESILETAREGLNRARSLPGRHYFQFPSPAPADRREELHDPGRSSLLREPGLEIPTLLRLFTRLALEVVPADRVSVMAREGDDLVIQVAVGFNGQEEVVRTARVPLNRRTISAWVAQHREPLLVQSLSDLQDLPRNEGATYRGDSFFSYPLLRGEELLGVINFSNRFDGQPFTSADVDRFAPMAAFLANYLDAARGFGGVRNTFLQESLFSIVDLMEAQIPGMEGHSREVARLARATAERLGLGDEEAEKLWVSGRLHDVGKVTYRTSILAEARALSPRE